ELYDAQVFQVLVRQHVDADRHVLQVFLAFACGYHHFLQSAARGVRGRGGQGWGARRGGAGEGGRDREGDPGDGRQYAQLSPGPGHPPNPVVRPHALLPASHWYGALLYPSRVPRSSFGGASLVNDRSIRVTAAVAARC